MGSSESVPLPADAPEPVTGVVNAVSLRFMLTQTRMTSVAVTELELWANRRDETGTYAQHLEQMRAAIGAERFDRFFEGARLAGLFGEERYRNPLFQITDATPLVVMILAVLAAVRLRAYPVEGYLGPDSWHHLFITGPGAEGAALPNPAARTLAAATQAVVNGEYDPASDEVISRIAFLVRLAAAVARSVREAEAGVDLGEVDVIAIKKVCVTYFET